MGYCRDVRHHLELLSGNVTKGGKRFDLRNHGTVQIRIQGCLAVEQIDPAGLLSGGIEKPDLPFQARDIGECLRHRIAHLLVFRGRYIQVKVDLQNHRIPSLMQGSYHAHNAAASSAARRALDLTSAMLATRLLPLVISTRRARISGVTALPEMPRAAASR